MQTNITYIIDILFKMNDLFISTLHVPVRLCIQKFFNSNIDVSVTFCVTKHNGTQFFKKNVIFHNVYTIK